MATRLKRKREDRPDIFTRDGIERIFDKVALRYKHVCRHSIGEKEEVSSARLELICHYRLHGNVESIAVLSGSENRNSSKRDSIVLTFRDAKITALEFDESLQSRGTDYVQATQKYLTGLDARRLAKLQENSDESENSDDEKMVP